MAEGVRHLVALTLNMDLVGLGKDRPDSGCDHLGLCLWHLGECVAEKVHPTAPPRGSDEHLLDCLFEPEMMIGDDEMHAGKAAPSQAAQECRPEDAVLRVPDITAQHLAVSVRTHTGYHNDSP